MARDGNKMAIYVTNQASSSQDEICKLEGEIDGLLSTIKGLEGQKGENEHKLLIKKRKLQAKIGYQHWILWTATTDPQFFVELIEKQEAKQNILKENKMKQREENWRLYTLKGKKCIQ